MNLRKYKYPLMATGLISTGMGLTYLYGRLGISPPISITIPVLWSAIIADHETTKKALKLGGKECNFFANTLFKKLGAKAGLWIILGLFIMFTIFMFVDAPPYQQLALGCAYWLIPINNLLVIRRLRKQRR